MFQRLLLLVCIAPGVLGACNDYPVHRLLDSFEVRVTDKLNHDKPVKLDFLWVIDQSASMCQEQRALSKAFADFTKELTKVGQVDAQMAVVTAQQAPDKTDIRVIGRFMHSAATAFPPNCNERVKMHCLNNGQCKQAHNFTFPKLTDSSMCCPNPKPISPAVVDKNDPNLAIGKWFCKAPPQATHVSNLNCSINSECQSRCNPDNGNKDCEAIFEDPGVECKIPGGGTNKDDASCIYPPDTKDCPSNDQLPDIVQQKDLLKYFKCNATVGAAQTPESRFEGGFRSAWMALDPKGPNCDYAACKAHLRTCCEDQGEWCKSDFNPGKCAAQTKELCDPLKEKDGCQVKRLVRDDAYLIIVFISDDDDCSMGWDANGKLLNPLDKTVISKEVWDACQVYGDALGGNVALNEGNCEFKREKATQAKPPFDIYCPSDCNPGSQSKTVDKGLLRCPKGCKVTCDYECAAGKGNADAQGAIKAKVEANANDGWLSCPLHCRTDSAERATCLQKAYEDLEKYTKRAQQFAPVDEYVKLFKSLKADPAHVLVASITGDALAASDLDPKTANCAGVQFDKAGKADLTERQKHRDRVNYYQSMLKDQGPGQAPYICAGARGESNYGSRYIQLAQAFRDNGEVHNVCEGDDFGPALISIAQTILKRVTRICLPQPPFADPQTNEPIITVQRRRGGAEKVLKFNEACDPDMKDSFCIKPAPDCRAGKATKLTGVSTACKTTSECNAGLTCLDGRCQPYNDAIFFPDVQEPGDEIEINFEADMGL